MQNQMQPNMYSNTAGMMNPVQQQGMMGGGGMMGGYGNAPVNENMSMFKKHRLV
jgi:hypothetical protein